MTDQTTDDVLFAPFWAYAQRKELAFPQCGDCQRFHWYPKAICPWCQSARVGWTLVDGPAKLYSWTVVRRAFTPEYEDKIPYTVALVEFTDAPGVRLLTNLESVRDTWHCGMALQPVFDSGLNRPHPRVTFTAA